MAVLRYFHQPPKATTSTVVVNNTAIQTVSADLNNKVDKSAGRGLSQNNYSTPEKNKLEGVEEGAEVNVQADWNEQDTESDAYIQNKPSVPILDPSGQIPASYLPSYVDDVLEYPTYSQLPQPGETGKIYVTTDTDLTYRWSGSTYIEISKSIITGVKGSAESNYRIGNVNLTAANIGLGNVVNLDQSKAIKSITRSGTTFTYTCLDGTTGTFTQQDDNTWRPITNTYTGSDQSTSVSQYGTNALYNALVNGYANSAGNADTVDNLHASDLVRFFLSPMASNAPADSAKSWFTNTMPSASGAIVYNVPGSEKTIIAGKSSGAHGHMLQLNYDDNYLRLLRYTGGNWKTTDWEKISAGYADSAGSVSWSNVSSKPETATRWPSWSEVTGKPSTFTPSSHTHDYLPLSGGTMTGSITMSQGASARNVGIVGTYDYTKSAAIWAMGASYQIPAAGNSLGSLYGAAYVYQGQAGQGTMAGGHQFVWAQNGSANVALGTNIWTSGKFIKNGGTSSQFLKADGSVDSNAYITGITKSMVTTALGYTPPTTDTNTWRPLGTGANDACAGNDSRLSNARPASDVYSWAKASTKPSYAWSEITDKPSTFTPSSHTHSYLPLSGGTCTGEVAIKDKADAKYVKFYNTNYTDFAGYVGAGSSSANYIFLEAYGNNSIIFRTNSEQRCQIDGAGKWWFPNHTSLYGGGELNIRGSEAGGTIYLSYCCSMNGSNYWYIPVDGKAHFVSVSQGSDVRKKDIVSDTNISITTIAQAPLFKFLWKDKNIDDFIHIGTSAQYWKENTPELVTEEDNEDKTLSIEYSTLGVAASISIAKEVVKMQNKIDTLEQRIQQLEEQLSKLIK